MGQKIIAEKSLAATTDYDRTWNDFAGLINTTWRKGVTAFIDTGRYLLEAKAELDRNAFASLVTWHLDFDASVGRKLMAIANNSVICAHGHKLPPSWTTIYELTKLDDEVLEAGFAAGVINPGIKRRDVSALRYRSEVAEPENSAAEEETLAAHWARVSKADRPAFFDAVGVRSFLDAMSKDFSQALRAELPSNLFAKLCEMDPGDIASRIFETVGATKSRVISKKLQALVVPKDKKPGNPVRDTRGLHVAN